MKPALPTRTVATMLTLKENGREIQLHVLGRGHTNGDLYTYLPKEKVIATGDALIDWMPFLNDGYPEDWVQTLGAVEKLDFTQIIPATASVVAQEPCGVLPRLSRRPHRRREEGVVRRRPRWPRCRRRSATSSRPSTRPRCPSIRSDGIATGSVRTSRWSTRR